MNTPEKVNELVDKQLKEFSETLKKLTKIIALIDIRLIIE